MSSNNEVCNASRLFCMNSLAYKINAPPVLDKPAVCDDRRKPLSAALPTCTAPLSHGATDCAGPALPACPSARLRSHTAPLTAFAPRNPPGLLSRGATDCIRPAQPAWSALTRRH